MRGQSRAKSPLSDPFLRRRHRRTKRPHTAARSRPHTAAVNCVAPQRARECPGARRRVVFVHGLWLLPSSWDRWAKLFEDNGYGLVPFAGDEQQRPAVGVVGDLGLGVGIDVGRGRLVPLAIVNAGCPAAGCSLLAAGSSSTLKVSALEVRHE